MKSHRVIIIGGGPAGAACAWALQRAGVDCLVLDKASFPRSKTCAGWITPRVLELLELEPGCYPYQLSRYDALKIFLKGFPIWRPGRQYAIRRWEFDDWLLKRSGARVETHHVRQIVKGEGGFLLDGKYRAKHLVGAGGTHCPVYHQVFKTDHPRQGVRIAALEVEFKHPWQDGLPRLWFLSHGLPGYSWYLPKAGGYLNIGVGGNQSLMKERGRGIRQHWRLLLEDLIRKGLVPERKFQPEGYVYHLQAANLNLRSGNAFLVGDSAGLATLDMGEGIGPAVASGIRAAEVIRTGGSYTLQGLERFSLLPDWLGWFVG